MVRRIAFAGFRHGHIDSLFRRLAGSSELRIAAVCEEDPESLAAFRRNHPDYAGRIHGSFDEMLAGTDCDVVAIGDYYGKRGSIAIRALQAGRNVLSDKPVCISLPELDRIEGLAAAGHLAVGCMLDLRTGAPFVQAREMVRAGTLGEIVQIQFSGQHPLMEGERPHWYFEEGKHGGTINDIAIHAFDYIPWMTGLEVDRIIAARTWHTPIPGCAFFKDGAQLMMTLDNGCGVLGDVSYSEPASHRFAMPQYWRFTVWGTKGALEFNCTENKVTAWLEGESAPRTIDPPKYDGPSYLDWFLDELDGKPAELDTRRVLKTQRLALTAQKHADETAA